MCLFLMFLSQQLLLHFQYLVIFLFSNMKYLYFAYLVEYPEVADLFFI